MPLCSCALVSFSATYASRFTRPVLSVVEGYEPNPRLKVPFLVSFIDGALKMHQCLRRCVSQKLASWKGLAKDDQAGDKTSATSAFSAINYFFVPLCLSGYISLCPLGLKNPVILSNFFLCAFVA
jgi:hypothetical protein